MKSNLPWRKMTCLMLPELAPVVERAENPYMLWFELRDAFDKAYDEVPANDSRIRRIYQFANWCDTQPRGETAEDDLVTTVAVCFYEHIPDQLAPWLDMPRWFSLAEFDNMRGLWKYCFQEEGYQRLCAVFQTRQEIYQEGLRRFSPKDWSPDGNAFG